MLPVHEALPTLRRALVERRAAVLVAPPGAGKTTVVPLALLEEPWARSGKIVVLEPRRLAARAAAGRMAATLGQAVGETVGLRVRMQTRVSALTRVEVVTEGVFTRMILADPALEGVAAVIFDEFHERSLDADFGLALACDARRHLREDLRVLVMSATLDGARIAALLEDAPVVESAGRTYPVETRHLGRDPRERIEDAAVRAVMKALGEEEGGLLVFLPGQGEIRRVTERLTERLGPRPDVVVAPLFGALTAAEQDRAIEPAPPGVRKIVLTTSIAETSLTIQGVRVVVDCGLSRVPRYDPGSGLTRLETVRVSRASADQRRGRAGRTEPGVCYRLWDERETQSLPAFQRPEILETDLSGFALDLARWGAKSADGLSLLDAPPAAAFAEARDLLTRLGALDANGDLTRHGLALGELPLPPRLAHMVVAGAAAGVGKTASLIAAVLTERGLGGVDADLSIRLEAAARDRSPRARDARALAERWAAVAERQTGTVEAQDHDVGLLLAEAYPERVARARGRAGEFMLASGRGVFVDPVDPLSREKWLAVGELGGGDRRDRILLAAPVEEDALLTAFKALIETETTVAPGPRGDLKLKRVRRLGKIVIDERDVDRPDPVLIERALLDQLRSGGVGTLSWGPRSRAVRARLAYLRSLDDGWPDVSDQALADRLDEWIAPRFAGRTALTQISDAEIADALIELVPWDRRRRLDIEAPERFEAPTGSRLQIDYQAEGGPRVEVRVQELYGLDRHPAVGGGRTPLTLALLSPARRPVQVTRDLPGFWRGSWTAVRSEMRGRYPKHPWPEDPTKADPTTRAKPRGT